MNDRIETLFNAICEHEGEKEEEEEESYRDVVVRFGREALWSLLGVIIIHIGARVLTNR